MAPLRPLVGDDADDLRNDVAGALHDDRVADAHVLALDLVLVVQRRVGDDDAADGHRLQPGDGRQRAGAPHLDVDAVEDGHRLLGGELVGDGPARRAGDEAQALLQVEAVHLVDDAVDVVGELGALLRQLLVVGEQLGGAGADARLRIDRQPPLGERLVDADCVSAGSFEASPQA